MFSIRKTFIAFLLMFLLGVIARFVYAVSGKAGAGPISGLINIAFTTAARIDVLREDVGRLGGTLPFFGMVVIKKYFFSAPCTNQSKKCLSMI